MSVPEIAVRILPVFLLLGFGAALKGARVANDRWVDILNRYGLTIGFPAIVLENLSRVSREDFARNYRVYGANAFLLILLIFLIFGSVRAFRVEKKTANSYVIGGFFGNIAYLGYPILTSVFSGVEGELSILISIYVALLFTVGVGILEVSKAHRAAPLSVLLNIVKNPLLIATMAGILLVLLDVPVPGFLAESLALLKASASPVVLIALGIFIVRRIRLKTIYAHVVGITVLRLFIVPFIFHAVGRVTGLSPGLAVSIVEAGMPLAVTPFALASGYPLDREVLGSAVVLSTLISIGTLPLLISIVM